MVTTNSFALNHDKNLQIYFFCVKRQAKNAFLKDVESTVMQVLQTPGIAYISRLAIYIYMGGVMFGPFFFILE